MKKLLRAGIARGGLKPEYILVSASGKAGDPFGVK